MFHFPGRCLAHYLSKPREGYATGATVDLERLSATLRPGDVLLVEGTSRFSEAIKYLTQSTWSHAALYVGDALLDHPGVGNGPHMLVEADINEGVRAIPLEFYADSHTRISRPVGLGEEEINAVIAYAANRLGYQYDVRNIVDLARYLIQKPPVPGRYRRQLVALGSGDPTRGICSSLIAQAFQSVHYPILPDTETICVDEQQCREVHRIRHHSLFVPRDFDISPYFQIMKASIEQGFDHRRLEWSDETPRPARESAVS